MQDTAPFPDFAAASTAVLEMLHQRFSFNLWMVTRTEGSNWVVLKAKDAGYGVNDGQVFNWEDSFCSQMVQGKGPRMAPRSADVPAYANAPINRQVQIGAYIGVPITKENGQLFGTLCAIHPTQRPVSVQHDLPLVELQAKLLSSLLAAELKQEDASRRAERAEIEAMLDELTGVFNRRAWEKLLAIEELRCQRHGHPAVVISLDIDGLKQINDTQGHAAGDELIQRAATAITAAARTSDIVARLGGDEFAILGIECDRAGGEQLVASVQEILREQNIKASIGLCVRLEAGDLSRACQQADADMYVQKRAKRAALQPLRAAG